jgi:signal transduction histidine kinase
LASEFINNLGLSESVEKSIRDIMEVNPVKIIWSSKDFEEETVNDKFKLTIYRIIQEQLNNIMKHARANKVTIVLSQKEDKIKLFVADNGIGFDTTLIHKGIGLANVKARASFYNATTDFNSKPGKGCVMNVIFPKSELLRKTVKKAM